MSEICSEEQAPEDVAVAVRPNVGQRLQAEREARGLSVAEVAAALKLSPRQIDALEAGDWGGLPGNAFVRGFVRNYARFVQLDAGTLLADLEVPTAPPPRLDPPSNVTAVMPAVGQAQNRDYAAVLGGFALLAVAVVAYFVVPPDFWGSTSATKAADTAPETASAAGAAPAALFPPATTVAGDDAGARVTVPENAPVAVAAVAATAAGNETAAREAAIAAPVPANAQAPVASADALRLRFSEPSWVEIRDRSGKIIFSQLNPAGSEQAVDGQPPFALVVGNAAHVTLTYKGRAVDLQPRSKDDVARITVE